MSRTIKVVVVGDGAVGKTCLLRKFQDEGVDALDEFIPTVLEDYRVEVRTAAGEQITLWLWDTAGGEDCERLRRLVYPDTDVFLVCFSVQRHISLENVREKWAPEISQHAPGCPFVLVATKTDLRSDPSAIKELAIRNLAALTYADGKAMAKKLGASDYAECSALTNGGVLEVFDKAVAVATAKDARRTRRRCNLI